MNTMTRPACLVQHLLLLLLLLLLACCSSISSARSLVQAEETEAANGMLPGMVGPALESKHSPDPNQSTQASQEQVTTAGSADIAQTIPALYSRMLARHNTFRARHRVANLTWDAGLAVTARTWARGCKFQHNPASGGTVGENLYAAWLGSATDLPKAAMQATNEWYREVTKYSYSNPGFSMATGHFTQVVWKATTKLGCFAAACPNLIPGWQLGGIVVCNYSPAGNFGGPNDYRTNVLPARRVRAAAATATENGSASAP